MYSGIVARNFAIFVFNEIFYPATGTTADSLLERQQLEGWSRPGFPIRPVYTSSHSSVCCSCCCAFAVDLQAWFYSSILKKVRAFSAPWIRTRSGMEWNGMGWVGTDRVTWGWFATLQLHALFILLMLMPSPVGQNSWWGKCISLIIGWDFVQRWLSGCSPNNGLMGYPSSGEGGNAE